MTAVRRPEPEPASATAGLAAGPAAELAADLAVAAETDGPRGDPFRYGWRYRMFRGPDGAEDWVRIPLTLEDVLHPQEEDFRVHTDAHNEDCRYLKTVFRARVADRADVRVLSDHRIAWDAQGTFAHGPDVAVIVGLGRDRRLRGTVNMFRESAAGASAALYVEVTSPDTRKVDLDRKVREYHGVGVPMYVIVDRRPGDDAVQEVIAYRRRPGNYVRVRPDRRGRVWLPEPLRLWIGHEGDRAVCWDGDTGERLQDLPEEMEARRRAEADAARERRKAAREAKARREAEARAAEAERKLRELEARLSENPRRRTGAKRAAGGGS